MHYYIDGYNLLFRKSLSSDGLKQEREAIIGFLSEKILECELQATVIFDAQYQPGLGSRTHLKNLEICYTDEGETADAHILRRIKLSKNPHLVTVVTSDHQLSAHVRRLQAQTLEIREFLDFLDKKANSNREKSFLGDKGAKKNLPKLKIASPSHTQKEESPPSPKHGIEESFDYYLYHFERKFSLESLDKPLKPESFKKRKKEERKGHKPKKSDEKVHSEFERWLKLFEEREDKYQEGI